MAINSPYLPFIVKRTKKKIILSKPPHNYKISHKWHNLLFKYFIRLLYPSTRSFHLLRPLSLCLSLSYRTTVVETVFHETLNFWLHNSAKLGHILHFKQLLNENPCLLLILTPHENTPLQGLALFLSSKHLKWFNTCLFYKFKTKFINW